MSEPLSSAALREVDTALARGRNAEALRLSERALARGRVDDDVAARLRMARGVALWQAGRAGPGAAEVEKAAQACHAPLSRARALETLGWLAWKSLRPGPAERLLEEALGRYAAEAAAAGVVRTLLKLGGLRRDCGRLADSGALLERAAEEASRAGRADLLAEARTAAGSLLAARGAWGLARTELTAAAEQFAREDDPRQHTRAGLCLAIVELAQGELASARSALARARAAACPEGSDPRTLGEVALLRCDLLLAVGGAEAARAEAGDALGLFARAGCGEGECRSRVRLAHCLLAQGRFEEARPHARRAVELAPPSRPELRAMALIALGRGLLRSRAAEAGEAFAAAQELSAEWPGFLAAARLGAALAGGRQRADAEVAGALQALETWGDRRILSHCLGAVDDTLGREPVGAVPTSVRAAEPDEVSRALAEAAAALAGLAPWPARWSCALRAVQGVLPWWRALLLGRPGWELRRDLDEPEPASPEDLACELAAHARGPALVDLAAHPSFRQHPRRVLHGLGVALVAPVRSGLALYVDFREGQAVGERELGILVHLARLTERHAPEDGGGEEAEASDDAVGPAFRDIVGRCAAMRRLLREAARVAGTDHGVHILGETGTGKERLARALHRASRRAGRPWVPVNASSIGDELFESEMFGHVRGAFTGAVSDRRGYVAEAEGGTLFLDEVTDLSPRAQAKLLRFLQEREYRRVGETRMQRADVRIVTASNVVLEQRVAAGAFRSDLMYRLGQHVLALPPLRERGEDVLLLARHCLREVAARAGQAAPALSREAAAVLCCHAWPGNVRELESEMARALVRCESGLVRPEHLSAGLSRPAPVRRPLRLAVDAFEREHIAQALQRNAGNRSRTAVELGLSRQALLAKITRLGIAPALRP